MSSTAQQPPEQSAARPDQLTKVSVAVGFAVLCATYIGRGTFEFLRPDNPKVLAFVRGHDNDCVLVVANLSRFTQPVSIDLSDFELS